MILSADRILTGDRHTVIADGAVCLRDGVIRMAGPRDAVRAAFPEEAETRCPGKTLMPGMIDLHVHLACIFDPAYQNADDGVSLRALYAAGKMADTLAAGVTTIRDASSADGIGTALKRAAADGYIRAPRIFACLQGICMTGGHGAVGGIAKAVIEADGVEEIRKAVRLNLKRGADCIKVLTSEGYRGQELNQEELNAAVAEAHRFGVKIAAHAGYGESIAMCLRAGFDSIEHGTHLTAEQAVYMRDHDITWVPTVLVFNYVYGQLLKSRDGTAPDLRRQEAYLADCAEAYRENVRTLYDTGVRVATGTDTDCTDYRGASPVAEECAWLVRCGLTPLEAVECATKNGADYLGLGDRLGQIREGYTADLILVSGNPAEDIGALRSVAAVYQAGQKVCG